MRNLKSLFTSLYKFFIIDKPVLGRWNLKHNHQICEDYMNKCHPDPGYPNNYY